MSQSPSLRVIRIPRTIWKQAALNHQDRIRSLLQPGLLPADNGKTQRRRQNRYPADTWTALDAKNPIYNFLIEYYGLKGVKGTKRLARWCPSPNLLLHPNKQYDSLEALSQYSNIAPGNSAIDERDASIFLEDVTEEDLATTLQLRGAILESDGALYSPSLWFQQKNEEQKPDNTSKNSAASAFLWYRSILQQTLQAEPILHCHGLHEWAMQYHPDGEPSPPSAKYQAHLPLRVSRQVISETVERKGISCTHVDALRFFAPAAGPLNHHGARLERMDQLRLEQPACVHAQMDLLKIALRLQPFCNPDLLQHVLQLAIDARRLDVAASPYDATGYGVGVIPVEIDSGRSQYRKQQRLLMERADPIRRELLEAYNIFLKLAFDEDPSTLEAHVTPSKERFAQAEPGGKPWRKNLVSPTV
ncbi:expressed unknown protein [Seminavis robusta]|uniref:Uncharacterized protein n=1 Tax=Seminavis robusta TaxID=568900 RepID=A0A9N8D724_9STRA|nr:expressed unknown protein [Seminavis robusta]|eukprot:Sro22_g015420.1 n/a (417) ;mRNA; f:117643-118988